jgi:succinyldiaminopimelate transaminase
VTAADTGFVPPPYPYDRLDRIRTLIADHHDSIVDLSIGTPFDPPPSAVVEALASSGTERSYPPSIGTPELRAAVGRWIHRRFGLEIGVEAIGATIGSKEFVATLPQFMRLRSPSRDTVLYPAISYPSYEMGATLAGCRAVPVPFREDGTLDLGSIAESDAERALLLWVNSPSNPTGRLDDLGAAARWGRGHDVPVFSDECYVEFTWSGPGRTILESGSAGVVAVHSLSKRSNLAGVRVGFYAGDPELVLYLQEIRKHAGLMVPGPAQSAGVAALDDDAHVDEQRERYRRRLDALAEVIGAWSATPVEPPDGGFYLWIPADDGWTMTERLAEAAGVLVSPGEFYGVDGTRFVRVAVVQPDDQIDLVASRLSGR